MTNKSRSSDALMKMSASKSENTFDNVGHIHIKSINDVKHLESLLSSSASQFILFETLDNGKTFALKNRDLLFQKHSKNSLRFFQTEDDLEVFYKFFLPKIKQVWELGEDFFEVIEIDCPVNGLVRAEVNIGITSKTELTVFIRDISSPFEAISKYEASKKSLIELQDTVPVGLFQVDLKGKLLYVNNWFANLLGAEGRKALMGKNFKDYFDDPVKANEYFKSFTSKKKVGETQILLTRKDGKKIWVIISADKVVKDGNGSTLIDGILYDISERNLALEKLKESEEMFRTMSQSMENILYIFDKTGKFIYCNRAATEISGYSEEEFLNLQFFDLIHPDFKDQVKEFGFKRIKGEEENNFYETKVVTRSGDERWLEISATQIILGGEPVVMGVANDITDRKKSLESIKRNKEKYKSLYSFVRLMADNVPDLIWAKNLEGEYIFANKALCDKLLLAKDTNEPVGKTDMYFAVREQNKLPDNPLWYTFGEISEESDNLVISSELSHHVDEYGYVNGKFIYLDVKKSPLYDDLGNLIGLVGSARDVTEQKELEKDKLREETLKHVVYKIGNAVNTTKDLNELFTVIRLEISQVINTTNMYIALYESDTGALTLPYFVDEKDRFGTIPNSNSLTHYLIKNQTPLLLTQSDYYKLAEENHFEIIGTPAKVWLGVPLQNDNETIGALVVQDYKNENAFTEKDLELLKFVSLQISLSISQKKADDALRENEFALRQIIDNVPVMIFAKDKKKRFVLANKEYARVYGKRVSLIEGKMQEEIHPYKDELDKYLSDDNLVLNEGKTVLNTDEVFTDLKGDRRIFQTIKIPIKTETEKGIALLGVAIDLTERNKEEEELKRAKEKAEESDRLKTAFLANMSHEIRTPMNAIVGFSELLNDPDLTPDSRSEFINLISDNSKLLLKLIEDIIDVAKIEARQVKVVKSTCQVNLILDELANHYEKLLAKQSEKKIKIMFKPAVMEEGFSIESDPFRFKQIVNNLLDNAVKFTENGSIEFGYQIRKNDIIEFYIKDTGIGVDENKLGYIFERFRQAEDSSTKVYRGTGLGLTIASRLVEMLGGKIWVESVHGKGSTFYFSLPYISKKVVEKLKPLANHDVKNDWAGKTILVAEDEISNFELINATLRRTNAKLIWASNGVEAVKLFKENPDINLVLMDIRMPEMNGYEATRIIKSHNKNVPVISLTAYAMAEDREKSVAAGCDEYVSKPFNPADLINKIGEFIRK